jgi:hypothetical protein
MIGSNRRATIRTFNQPWVRIRPSLRDGSVFNALPGNKLPGYDHSVPPGQSRASPSGTLTRPFAVSPRDWRLLHSTDTKRDSTPTRRFAHSPSRPLRPTPTRPFAHSPPTPYAPRPFAHSPTRPLAKWYASGCRSRFRSFYEFSRLTTNRTLAYTVISFPLF